MYYNLYVIDVINVYYYMALSHRDWELPDLGIWLAEMDIDRLSHLDRHLDR